MLMVYLALYRYEDVLVTEQIEEGNYDLVTATDIRILADKLLDEENYRQLINSTATVNMVEVLPDNEKDQSFELYELINLINKTIKTKVMFEE